VPDVFLSYSREDQATARRFAEGLERAGFSVWWDQALHPGEAFDQVTEQALDAAKAVIVLWSKTSVNSRWVRAEATQANANHRLVPVMIEACKRPIMFELTHTAELANWQGDAADPAWQAFVASLRRFTEKAGIGATTAGGVAANIAVDVPRVRRLPRWAIGWSAGLAVLAVAAALAWFIQGRTASQLTGIDASVVVLPFDDESPEKGQANTASGISDQIRDTLSRIEGLKVTPPTSSIAIKEKAGNPQQVGATLGVAHQLEGKVSRSADRLRISVWLVSTATGEPRWSQTYDRPLSELFELRDDIAAQVAQALQVKLGIGVAAQPGMTRDVEAFDAYVEAQSLLLQFTPETRRRCIALLERAVARDENFALAWRLLWEAARGMPTLLGADAGRAEAPLWQAKEEAAARRFEEIMQGTPELLLWRSQPGAGSLVEAAGNLEAAAQQAQKLGLQWNAGNLAPLLLQVGRTHEAIELLEQERARDPLNPTVFFVLANAYNDAGNTAAALALVEQGERDLPAGRVLFSGIGSTIALGMGDEALLRRRLEISIAASPQARGFSELIKGLIGKPAEARQVFTTMASGPNVSSMQRGIFAQFSSYFGDSEGALALLRADPAAAAYVDLWSPVFRDMRKLAAFKQYARDRGLVDYWRAYRWADLCAPTAGEDFECR
jgi:TolB-like protein